MAVEVMAWVFAHSRSKNAERLVMLAVADACNKPDGTGAWMSYAALCAKTNLSERAAHAAVRACEGLGELEVARTAGRGGVNRYAVIMSSVDNAVDNDRKGAESAGLPERAQNLRGAESADIRTDEATQANDGKGADSAGEHRRRKGAESAPGTVKTSSTKKSSSKKTSTKTVEYRDDVEHVCRAFAEWRVRNGCVRPTITDAWRTEARLMIDKDRRPMEQIRDVMAWSQRHHFWKSTVKSIPKFREQFDSLRLQMEGENKQGRRGGNLNSGPSRRIQNSHENQDRYDEPIWKA